MAPDNPGLNGGDETNFDIPEGDDLDSIEIPAEEAPSTPAEPVSGAPGGGAPPAAGASPSPPSSPTTPVAVAGAPPPPVPPSGGQQAPQAPAVAAPAAPAPAEGPPPVAPQTFEQAFESNRVALEQHIASTILAINDADRDELATSADTFIPKYAAKVLSTAISSVHRQIQQFVPSMVAEGIQSYLAAEKANASAEEQFFSKWPSLKGQDEKFEPLLRAFITANPKASRESVIDSVGIMAHQALGIPFPVPGPPAKPAKAKTPPPFVPAGGGLPGNAVSQPVDEWAGFGLPNSGDE